MSGEKKKIVLTIPDGVSESDLSELLRGFSKATGSGEFNMERVPQPYETQGYGENALIGIRRMDIMNMQSTTTMNDQASNGQAMSHVELGMRLKAGDFAKMLNGR